MGYSGTRERAEDMKTHICFEGEEYPMTPPADPDAPRFTSIRAEIAHLMSDGAWWTLTGLRDKLGRGSDSTISAKLRDLRKAYYGWYVIESEPVKRKSGGISHYRYRMKLEETT